MTAKEETQIIEKISREVIAKKRLLYSYEIKEILDQFIVKGEWIEKEETPASVSYYCSNCKMEVIPVTPFCPWCGAEMHEKEEENGNNQKR